MSPRQGHDEAVNPVIAVVMLVLIVIVLAASVFVWLSTFGDEVDPDKPVGISAESWDSNSDGDDDWIRLTLVKGEGAPFKPRQVAIQVTDPDGDNHLETDETDYSTDDPILCRSTNPTTSTNVADVACDSSSGVEADWFEQDGLWGEGGTLYVPCQGRGEHHVAVAIDGTVVLDRGLTCGEPALS